MNRTRVLPGSIRFFAGLALALCASWVDSAIAAAPATVAFDFASRYLGPETNGSIELRVVRSGDTALEFSVDYATSNSTATAGQDYVAQNGTLHFLPGQTTQSITLVLLDDFEIEESWEGFEVWLSNSTGGVAINPALPLWIGLQDDEGWSFFDGTFHVGRGPNSTVFALARQPDGKVLAAGDFTYFQHEIIGGGIGITYRSRVARLNSDGVLDLSFYPGTGPNATVYALALQTNGQVLIGGSFTNVAGAARGYLARLNVDGSLDVNFAPIVNNELRALAVQPDGRIVIAGRFTTVGGNSRNRVARLNANGVLDTSFNPGIGADSSVRALALQGDGRVLIAGQFATVNGVSRNGIARLNTDGSLDTSFIPGAGADDEVRTLAVQPDGKILIGGDFEFVNGTNRNHIARLNTDGGLDLTFDPGTGASDRVRAVAVQPDSRVLVGGQFNSVNNVWRPKEARLHPNGSVDLDFRARDVNDNGLNDEVFAMLVQPDGFVVVGGQFVGTNGFSPSHLMRVFGDQELPSFIVEHQYAWSSETNGAIALTVRRLGDTSGSLSVDFTTFDESAIGGSDYLATNGTLTFAPREVAKTVPISLINDHEVEWDESFRFWLVNPSSGSRLGLPAETVVYLYDNDTGVGFDNTGISTFEGDAVILATVTRGGDSAEIASVEYFTIEGTALAGVDFVPTNGVLTFGPGEFAKTIAVPILPDGIIEGTEILWLTLTNASGIGLAPNRTNARLEIIDASGSFAMAISNVVVREDVPSGHVAVEVHRRFPVLGVGSVDYATQDGTAKAGEDYVATSGTLVFGNLESVKTIYVPILNDGAGEPYEDFKVVLSNPSTGTSISWIPFTWVTLVDEDGVIQFTTTNLSVAENAGTVTATVERLGAVTNTATINYATTFRSAQANLDFIHTTGTLTFTNGQTSHTITVPILNDGLMEGSESFMIELFNPIGATLGPARAVTVTILDNDGPIRLVPATNLFLGTNLVVSESAGQAVFTVERNNDGQGAITVDYLVTGGTASNGLDYAVSGSSVTIPAGGTNAMISLSILEDTLAERDETLFVKLLNVTGDGSLGDATNTALVILDNDRPGALDPSFDPDLTTDFQGVRNIVVLHDGRIVLDQWRDVFRLLTDGTRDPGFVRAEFPHNGFWGLAVQSDGKVLLGSLSYVPDGAPGAKSVRRLLPSGACDDAFLGSCSTWFGPPEGNGFALVALSDGKTLIGGTVGPFVGYTSALGLARLLPDGQFDPAFVPVLISNIVEYPGAYDVSVRALAVQPDGKILLAGGFTHIHGAVHVGLARVHADGTLDTTFNANLDENVSPGLGAHINAFVVQPDGRIVIGGRFDLMNLTARTNVARLWPDGSLDTSFTASASGEVLALARQSNGRIVVSGAFSRVNGTRQNRIARLNGDGTLDISFDPGTGPGDCDFFGSGGECVVTALAVQADGQILAGGNFTSFNGLPRSGLVRLVGDLVLRFNSIDRSVNSILLTLTCEPGQTYVLEVSTNLMNWTSIQTNTATGDRLSLVDADASSSNHRFYRAKCLTP